MYYFQDEPDNALPYIGTLIFCHFTFSYSPVYNAQLHNSTKWKLSDISVSSNDESCGKYKVQIRNNEWTYYIHAYYGILKKSQTFI